MFPSNVSDLEIEVNGSTGSYISQTIIKENMPNLIKNFVTIIVFVPF